MTDGKKVTSDIIAQDPYYTRGGTEAWEIKLFPQGLTAI